MLNANYYTILEVLIDQELVSPKAMKKENLKLIKKVVNQKWKESDKTKHPKEFVRKTILNSEKLKEFRIPTYNKFKNKMVSDIVNKINDINDFFNLKNFNIEAIYYLVEGIIETSISEFVVTEIPNYKVIKIINELPSLLEKEIIQKHTDNQVIDVFKNVLAKKYFEDNKEEVFRKMIERLYSKNNMKLDLLPIFNQLINQEKTNKFLDRYAEEIYDIKIEEIGSMNYKEVSVIVLGLDVEKNNGEFKEQFALKYANDTETYFCNSLEEMLEKAVELSKDKERIEEVYQVLN